MICSTLDSVNKGMRPKLETRCFWFEDDGTPLRASGCPRGYGCGFTHPGDELWGLLHPQRSRPPGYGSKESGRYHDDGLPSPSRSRRHRSSSRSRSTSRHRSRDRERKKASRSPVQTRSDRDGSSSTSMVVTNGTPSALPTHPSLGKIRLPPGIPKKPPPTGPSALRISSALDAPAVIFSNNNKKSPPPRLAMPSSPVPGLTLTSLKAHALPPAPVSTPPSQPPPPPPPSTSTAMPPPPYPLPEIPEGLTFTIPPQVEEPSPAEKRKVWEERVKLFADAYQAKQDLDRCEQMYKYASDISQSSLFPTLSDEDKARYNAELAELIVDRDKARKGHDDAVEHLIEQGSWPLGPPPSTKADEQGEAERRDILRHVQELNDTAQKMSKILGDIAMKTTPPTLPLPADDDDDDTSAEDAMDMDDAADAPDGASGLLPSRKRQRLQGDGDGVTRPAVDPDLPTREELDVYRNRLEKLEGKIIDLDDELVQYDQDIRRSFKDDVENKIEEYDNGKKQQEAKRREKEKIIRDEEMTKVRAEAESLENDVSEVGKEVAEVISKIESLKIQLVEETKQRDVMENKVAQVNERLQGYIQQRQSNVRKMQTLEAALKAYLSSVSRPSPPATPSTELVAPTSDYILSQLQEPILQVIRQHLQPMLAQSRIDTESLVKERNMEIVRKVWPRMELVSRLLAIVAEKLDREDSLTSPVDPAPAPAPLLAHPMPAGYVSQVHVPHIMQHQSTNPFPIAHTPWDPR